MVVYGSPVQRIDGAEKLREVSRREGREWGWIDREIGSVSFEAGDQFGETQSSICSVDVEDFVFGEVFEDRSVFFGEWRVEVGDEEDDVAVEAVSGGEEGNENVSDAVEEVPDVSASGEEDGRSG